MAGGTGTRSLGWTPAKARSRSGSERARLAFTRARESGRLVKMGTSLIDSVPPAMATWLTPSAMAEATSVKAWIEVAQARLTVCASIPRGSAEARPTSRAMLGASERGDRLTEDDLVDLGGVDVRALDQLPNDGRSEVQRGERGEDAARLDEGGAEPLHHDGARRSRVDRGLAP